MTFSGWLEEVEVYSTRQERLMATFAHMDKSDWEQLMKWLSAAYEVGYEHGKTYSEVPF